MVVLLPSSMRQGKNKNGAQGEATLEKENRDRKLDFAGFSIISWFVRLTSHCVHCDFSLVV